MQLIRELHPVGHGAFFTERIRNEGKTCFTFIYDCGSYKVDNVVRVLNQVFQPYSGEHIDLLCISHFDKDHINGLISLLSRCKVDSSTVVLMPFKYPKALVVADHPIASLLSLLMFYGTHIVGVYNSTGREEFVFGQLFQTDAIPEGARIFLPASIGRWVYVPLMHDEGFESVLEEFNRKIENLDIDYNQIGSPAAIGHLKSVYQNLPSLVHGNVTAINMNSLMILSYPLTNKVEKSVVVQKSSSLCQSIQPSCLYTGDTSFQNQQVFSDLLQRVFSYGCSQLGLLQIPHHGSNHCYNSSIAQCSSFSAAFVNYDSMYKNSNRLACLHDFNNRYPILLRVTKDINTRVVHKITI